MTIALRDRPDGRVEILLMDPIILETVKNREMAKYISVMLGAEEVELPDCRPPSLVSAAADVAEAEAEARAEVEQEVLRRPRTIQPAPRAARALAEDEDERPMPPAFVKAPILPAEETAAAFARIQAGERIGAVAPDFGLTMAQLRAMWANNRRQLQKHIAESGKQPCTLCTRPFIPSVDHPDRCARCRHA